MDIRSHVHEWLMIITTYMAFFPLLKHSFSYYHLFVSLYHLISIAAIFLFDYNYPRILLDQITQKMAVFWLVIQASIP